MGQHETNWAARWLIASVNPLVDTAARIEIDLAFKNVAISNPDWFVAWGSGYLSDIICTLNEDDPWRRLSLTDEGEAVNADGTPFGSWIDFKDMARPSEDDLQLDVSFAPAASPLNDQAASMIAKAGDGMQSALAWCHENLVPTARDEGDQFFQTVTSALRYARLRRASFEGYDDHTFVMIAGAAWVGRAKKIVEGKPWDESGAARFRYESMIPDGQYSALSYG